MRTLLTGHAIPTLAATMICVAACNDSETQNDAQPPNDASVEAGPTPVEAGPTPVEAGPGDGGGAFEPERLVREAASVCPVVYRSEGLASGWNDGFDVGGQLRRLYLRLPDASRFQGPRPLMVYFHGTGLHADAIDGARRSWADEWLERGAIVVGLEGYKNPVFWPVWDSIRTPFDGPRVNRDLALFDAAVDCLAAHLEVDALRIYVSGFSAGGGMANVVLRARSPLLAGGVAGSGGFDGTQPDGATTDLDAMAVVVSWGGAKDQWSGDVSSTGYASLVEFDLVTHSALASQHYAAQPRVRQLYCHGPDDQGHGWLRAANPTMAGYLLAHPKGGIAASAWTLSSVDLPPGVTCGEEALSRPHPVTVTCGGSGSARCRGYCQDFGDCIVENYTVGPVMTAQAKELGFGGGDYPTQCDGCVSACEADLDAGGAGEQGVLDCFASEAKSASCGQGILGTVPFVSRVATCCAKQQASAVCQRLCQALAANPALGAFFATCADFDPWTPDTSCGGTPFPATVADPVFVSGLVGDRDGVGQSGATVAVHRVDDDALIGSVTSAADGSYSLSIPTGGKPTAVYFRVTKAGLPDSYRYLGYPLTGNGSASQKIFTAAQAKAYFASGGISPTAGTGQLLIEPRDCGLTPVGPGVEISTTPPAPIVAYAQGAGCQVLDAALTATTGCTLGVAVDLAPGEVDVAATLGDLSFEGQTVKVVADAMTWVTLQPKRP